MLLFYEWVGGSSTPNRADEDSVFVVTRLIVMSSSRYKEPEGPLQCSGLLTRTRLLL